mmetsp:Transcript_8443/g.26736  ORF Transcript_8443/g.26736 Transcript_8443/m.26736 type:complete len:204 (+) Transcript_8443:28-639(+)
MAHAEFSESYKLHVGVYDENLVSVKALLKAGKVDMSLVDRNGSTALHAAAMRGCQAIAVELITAGANIDARSHSGYTPLHWAAGHQESPQIARALINAGADVHARETIGGSTPARLALFGGHRSNIKLLLRAGATMTSLNHVPRISRREAAFAMLDSVKAAGGWDEYVLRHRAILKSIVSKCAPLPDDCLFAIAAFICPPGGW